MHADTFIHDIAIIMLVAGIITVIFHKFKQPVILGYLLAGIIIGPYTPPVELVHDKHTITTLAELGVVFLMFSLGLEFSLKKLAKVGATAFVAALCETSFMIFIGYNLGLHFGWKTMDSLFLGAMMAISSTTIIVKALGEMGMKHHRFAQLIFGMLIVEDILAIGIIAILPGVAMTGSLHGQAIFGTIGKLSLFIIAALIIGLLTIPRLLAYIAKFHSNEMLLIAVLGLCFGFCLMVLALKYSIALGSFMIGAIVAESKPLHLIEKLVAPVRDMFSAIFFVTIGMMFNPHVVMNYFIPILVISGFLIAGKVIGCTFGTYISGETGRTSLRVGMGMAQIGEFSFIIAALGTRLNVTSGFLYPIAIAVSAITTLSTPYLIKAAPIISENIRKTSPSSLVKLSHKYTSWLSDLQPKGDSAMIAKIIVRISLQVLVNCALVAVVFIAGTFIATHIDRQLNGISGITWNEQIHKSIICSIAMLISLPFLIAAYRKLKALSMMFAEVIISNSFAGKNTYKLRRIVFELLPVIAITGILSFILSLSNHILPNGWIFWTIIAGTIAIALIFWNQFVKFQSWLQIQLFDVMEEEKLDDGVY